MTTDSTATTASGHADAVDQRSRAFVALALGLLGALGGGVVAHTIQSIALLDGLGLGGTDYLVVVLLQGLSAAALGGGAIVLARGVTALDAVATPAARAAVVLGVIAVAGGLVTAAIGLVQRM